MNILASYDWIKEHVALKESAEEFARKVSLCGPAAERLYPQAPLYDRMVVGVITAVNPHPNPKVTKLRLATLDVGAAHNGPLTLVCGGSNLEPGMKVAVALVGAKVRWHGQGDLIELGEAEIQGVKSAGMICGANEIGLAEAFPHAEREILDLSWNKAKAGTPLAKALELEDTVMDIEVTTNRPDAFCMAGLAREASAILGGKLLTKDGVVPSLPKGAKALPLTVKVSAPKLCTRYQAVVMTGVCAAQSPWWMKKRLMLSGVRPINAVVDIANYVMLELGQPMHAFDYDKLAAASGAGKGAEIHVREARAGEKLLALDSKEYALAPGQLVIADAEKPVAVAGVMGGEVSGVTDATTTIVFESATFDAVSVRRTARALNLHSDSSLRYEKGLPEDLTAAALARAVELCQKVACGKVASAVSDVRSAPHKKTKYAFRPAKAAELIGVDISAKEMTRILKALGFGVSGSGARLDVTVPYWRERDIEGERDLTEEIARVYGYHNLPSVMPAGEIPARPEDPRAAALADEERAKRILKGAGCTELISYSMVPRAHFERVGMDSDAALRIANPLSTDFEFMRMSLLPGFLQTISENQGLFPSGSIFETGNCYTKGIGDLPSETLALAAAVYGPQSPESDGELFLRAKGLLEAYAAEVGVHVAFERMAGGPQHPGRAAKITVEGETIGWVAETHPAVLKRFGIDGRVAAFELPLAKFLSHRATHAKYMPIPQFPPAKRDLAVIVGDRTEYADLRAAMSRTSALLKETELFDVYQGKGMPAGKKSMAVHLTFAAPERTLTAEETEAQVAAIMEALKSEFGAEARG